MNIDEPICCWIKYSWELQTGWFHILFEFVFSVSHPSVFQIWERTVLNVLLLLDVSSDVVLTIVTNIGVELYP